MKKFAGLFAAGVASLALTACNEEKAKTTLQFQKYQQYQKLHAMFKQQIYLILQKLLIF